MPLPRVPYALLAFRSIRKYLHGASVPAECSENQRPLLPLPCLHKPRHRTTLLLQSHRLFLPEPAGFLPCSCRHMSGSSGFPVPFRTYHHELPATVPVPFLPAVTVGRMSFPDCDGSPIRTDPVQYPSGQFPDEPELVIGTSGLTQKHREPLRNKPMNP